MIPAALAGASENGGVPAVPTDEVLTTESGLPKNPAPVNHPEDAWAGYIDPAFYQLANSVTTRRGAAQGYPADDQSLVPQSVAYDFRLGVSRPNLSENLKAVKVLLSVPDIREAITSAGWTVSPEIEQFLDEVQFASNAQGTEGPVNAGQEGTPIFSDLMADYAVISIGQDKPGNLHRITITRNSWEGYYDFRARIDQRISDLKLTYPLVARDITVQYRSNPTESSLTATDMDESSIHDVKTCRHGAPYFYCTRQEGHKPPCAFRPADGSDDPVRTMKDVMMTAPPVWRWGWDSEESSENELDRLEQSMNYTDKFRARLNGPDKNFGKCGDGVWENIGKVADYGKKLHENLVQCASLNYFDSLPLQLHAYSWSPVNAWKPSKAWKPSNRLKYDDRDFACQPLTRYFRATTIPYSWAGLPQYLQLLARRAYNAVTRPRQDEDRCSIEDGETGSRPARKIRAALLGPRLADY